jgi:hypothetical protein
VTQAELLAEAPDGDGSEHERIMRALRGRVAALGRPFHDDATGADA